MKIGSGAEGNVLCRGAPREGVSALRVHRERLGFYRRRPSTCWPHRIRPFSCRPHRRRPSSSAQSGDPTPSPCCAGCAGFPVASSRSVAVIAVHCGPCATSRGGSLTAARAGGRPTHVSSSVRRVRVGATARRFPHRHDQAPQTGSCSGQRRLIGPLASPPLTALVDNAAAECAYGRDAEKGQSGRFDRAPARGFELRGSPSKKPRAHAFSQSRSTPRKASIRTVTAPLHSDSTASPPHLRRRTRYRPSKRNHVAHSTSK